MGNQRLPWKTGESTCSLESPKQFPSTSTLENDQKQSATFKELIITVPWAGEKAHRTRGEEMVTRSSCFLPKALQWLLRTCKITKPFLMSYKALHNLAPPPQTISLPPHSLQLTYFYLLNTPSSFLFLDLHAMSFSWRTFAFSLHLAASFLSLSHLLRMGLP